MLQEPDNDAFGFRLPNGSFTGTLGRLIRHQSDLALTGFFIKDYLTRGIEFTAATYNDRLCCVVEKAKRIPSVLLPLSSFKPHIWIYLFITAFISAVFWAFLRKMYETNVMRTHRERCDHRNNDNDAIVYKHHISGGFYLYSQILIDMFILMISAQMRRISKFTSERCFICAISILSLVFVSIFQSNLATVYIKPLYYKDINTLSELDNSELRIGLKYQGLIDDIFPANSSILFESLRNKLLLVNFSVMQYMVTNGNLATATRKTTISLDNAIYFRNNSLHLIPDCPRVYNLAYAVQRYSVFSPKINEILLQLLNGGIISKWIKDMNYNQTMKVIRSNNGRTEIYKVLGNSDLELAYIILLIGITLSSVIFCLENYLARRIFKKKRNNLIE